MKYQPITGEVCNAIGVDIYSCCSPNNQCGLSQGDCDSDNDCSGNLVCGTGNCLFPFPLNADCCTGNLWNIIYPEILRINSVFIFYP